MGLSDDEFRQVGAPPSSVRLPPESGGGYLAYLASHHHLHCLVRVDPPPPSTLTSYTFIEGKKTDFLSQREIMEDITHSNRTSKPFW